MNLRIQKNTAFMFKLGIAPAFRILWVIMALVLAGASLLFSPPSYLGLVLTAMSILGACYDEALIINVQTEQAVFRVGLVFFAKETKLNFQDIQEWTLERFLRGIEKPNGKASRWGKKYASLCLISKSGKRYVIETVKGKAILELEKITETIGVLTKKTPHK